MLCDIENDEIEACTGNVANNHLDILDKMMGALHDIQNINGYNEGSGFHL